MIKNLVRDSAVYGFGIVASRFVNVLLLPIYTRLFGRTEYGALDLLTSTLTMLLVLSELQVVSAIAREYYEVESKAQLKRLIGNALGIYTITSAVFVIGGCGLYLAFVHRFPPYIGWPCVLALLLGLFPNQVFGLFQNLLRLELRRWPFVFFSIADVTTSAAFSLALVFSGFGLAGVFCGLALSKTVWGAVLVILHRRIVSFHLQFSGVKKLLSYGAPLVPSVLAKWGQTYANRYVLALALSLADVATYSVALQLSAIIAIIDSAFQQAWIPRAMKLFAEPGAEPVFARTFRIYLGGMFGLAAAVAIFGAAAVSLIAGQKYANSAPLMGFLAFGLLWNGATGMLSLGNAWARQTYWNVWGIAAGLVLNIALLIATVKSFGVVAAGVTYLIGTMAAAIIVLVTAQRNHRIPYHKPDLWAAGIACLLFGCGLYRLGTAQFITRMSFLEEIGLRLLMFAAILSSIAVWHAVQRRRAALVLSAPEAVAIRSADTPTAAASIVEAQ